MTDRTKDLRERWVSRQGESSEHILYSSWSRSLDLVDLFAKPISVDEQKAILDSPSQRVSIFFQEYWQKHPVVFRAPQPIPSKTKNQKSNRKRKHSSISSPSSPFQVTLPQFWQFLDGASPPPSSSSMLHWSIHLNAYKYLPQMNTKEQRVPNLHDWHAPVQTDLCKHLFGIAMHGSKSKSKKRRGKKTPDNCISHQPSEQYRENATKENFGHTSFQLHQPQQNMPDLAHAMAKLESLTKCLWGSNLYVTPAASQGLAPHHDDIDAFIIQGDGQKEWFVYNPLHRGGLPLESSRDLDRASIGKPVMHFTLSPGDVLYLPRGWVHEARTPKTCHSVHLTISTNHQWTYFDYLTSFLNHVVNLKKPNAKHLKLGKLLRSTIPRDLFTCPQQSRKYGHKHFQDIFHSMSELLLEHQPVFLTDFFQSRLPPAGDDSSDIIEINLVWCDGSSDDDLPADVVPVAHLYHGLENQTENHLISRSLRQDEEDKYNEEEEEGEEGKQGDGSVNDDDVEFIDINALTSGKQGDGSVNDDDVEFIDINALTSGKQGDGSVNDDDVEFIDINALTSGKQGDGSVNDDDVEFIDINTLTSVNDQRTNETDVEFIDINALSSPDKTSVVELDTSTDEERPGCISITHKETAQCLEMLATKQLLKRGGESHVKLVSRERLPPVLVFYYEDCCSEKIADKEVILFSNKNFDPKEFRGGQYYDRHVHFFCNELAADETLRIYKTLCKL
eukprot:g3664.t1